MFLFLQSFGQTDSTTIYIPQSFTPNNDGINDVFIVKTENVVKQKLEIYNIWGCLVFNSDDNNAYWNGDDGSGYYSQTGIYFWKLFYTDRNSKKGEINGHVIVIR